MHEKNEVVYFCLIFAFYYSNSFKQASVSVSSFATLALKNTVTIRSSDRQQIVAAAAAAVAVVAADNAA